MTSTTKHYTGNLRMNYTYTTKTRFITKKILKITKGNMKTQVNERLTMKIKMKNNDLYNTTKKAKN